MAISNKAAVNTIIGISIAVPLVVVVLMYLPTRYDLLGLEVGTFPFFHACINFMVAILLLVGISLIRAGRKLAHRNVMITAFALSAIFLVSYVISKISNEPVPFEGEGMMRYIYFFILITHIVLSGIILPLVLFTMYFGLTGKYDKHVRIARWTFPIWLYVAITGVLVYVFMLPYY